MHMIGHEAVGMHSNVVPRRDLAQVRQVAQVVVVSNEASTSIVSTLNDVESYSGQDQSRLARHIGKTDCVRRR
jgi:hypothetical protein